MRRFKGQVSAEMLILIVVILAVVAIAAAQLIKTAEQGGEQITNTSEKVLRKADVALKSKAGEICAVDDDCLSNNCNRDTRSCE